MTPGAAFAAAAAATPGQQFAPPSGGCTERKPHDAWSRSRQQPEVAAAALSGGSAAVSLLRRRRRKSASSQSAASRGAASLVRRQGESSTRTAPVAAESSQDTSPPGEPPITPAQARRSMRAAEYQDMKRESFIDTVAVGILGAPLVFFNSGPEAASGLALGVTFGALYHLLLQRDVDALAPGNTPFDLFNPLRIIRFLLPVLLTGALCASSALSMGMDAWLAGLSWDPESNFKGFLAAKGLNAALLGYIVSTASVSLRGIARNIPEVGTLVKAAPGSVGVAMKLKDDYDAKRSARNPAETPGVLPVRQVPVLLVSGPRGCGKSTLVRRLMAGDDRFIEPEWVASAPGGVIGDRRIQQVLGQEDYDTLRESGSLAVNFKPYDEEGEQLSIGLPAMEIISKAASEKQACILDVDTTTARNLLGYDWEMALSAASSEERLELRLISVWVSLPSLNAIVERNRQNLEAGDVGEEAIERQLKPLRKQVTFDMEWALTSGAFEFTVFNERQEDAFRELRRAAQYCFEDPF